MFGADTATHESASVASTCCAPSPQSVPAAIPVKTAGGCCS
jgi:hypothetical protein